MSSVPREPHLSRFRELIRQGAGTLDIHDDQDASSLYTSPTLAPERLVQREVERVDLHLSSVCRLLCQAGITARTVLDVGCGTGATTVALALTRPLGAQQVIGIDPNRQSLAAARERWLAHRIDGPEVSFVPIASGTPLPYDDGSFDLCVCVSVIEYLGQAAARREFAAELLRVTRAGGTVCLITPNPFRLLDYHTHRLLGDFRRTSGYPWASTPGEIQQMFAPHPVRFLLGEQLSHGLTRRGVPLARAAARLSWLGWLLPWQKVLVTRT